MSHFTDALSHLAGAAPRPTARPAATQGSAGAFQAVLADKLDGEASRVRFSRHARERLEDRRIELSPDDLQRIDRATEMAEAKGAREALMLLGDVNLIVSVRNRTVVTAMPPQDGRVYTNIDTAVMVGREAGAQEEG
jgi:flagellar operon protein